MRVLVLLAVLLLLLLPGCADTVDSGPEATASVGGATEHTGIIRGVVVDEAVVPVEGATVSLPDAGANTTTDAVGSFRFVGLDPGTYRVQVEASGFLPVQSSARVEAGIDDPPAVTIQLSHVGPSWWVEAHQVAGALEYGTSLAVAGQDLGGVSCCSDYFWEHEFTRGRPDWIQSEALWDPSVPTSQRMSLTHSGDETCVEGLLFSACALEVYDETEGESPIVLATPGDDVVMRDEDPMVVVSLFTGEVGEEGVLEAGAAFEQRFELFVHVFYGFAPTQGWAFVADGPHPVPPE